MGTKGPPRGEREAGRLTESIYESLRREIIDGELKLGESLSRRQIAMRFGCSYTPVVEVLLRLEHAGLVESISHQMARVCRISVEKIQGDYVLREALEAQTIRLACEQATSAEIDELRRLAIEVDAKLSQVRGALRAEMAEEASRLDWAFHRRLAVISRSPALVRELDRIETSARLKANLIAVVESDLPSRYHENVVDALEGRDPIAADAVMRAHVRKGLERELRGYLTAQSSNS